MLVQDVAGTQEPIYYINKHLLDIELCCPELERLALTLVTSTRKLHYDFLAHLMIVFTNHPIKQKLYRLEVSGRLVKWAVMLTQFNINYQTRIANKG